MSKSSTLQSLINTINKKFGEDTANFLTPDFVVPITTFSTGSIMLDLALGRGGYPRGYVMELFGDSMGGKTTLCLIGIASIQAEEYAKSLEDPNYQERTAVFIDAEHTFDAKLAAEYGVNLEKLVYINPKSAENAVDIAEALIRSGEVAMIVFDSVPAMVPSKISESSMDQQTMALLARLMSQALQKLVGPAYLYDTTLAFINQVREKPGVMYGSPLTTPGGRALPFYSAIRIHVKKGDEIKNGDDVVGHRIKAKIVKNKFAIPYKVAEFPLMYGIGIDRHDEISQMAILAGIIRQQGAWFYYEDEDGKVIEIDGVPMKFQGRVKFNEALKAHADLADQLEYRLRNINVEAPEEHPSDTGETYFNG